MFDGLLPRLEIGLVGPLARLEPRYVLRSRDRLRSCAVLPVASARRVAVAGSPAAWLRRSWRRGHLHNVRQRAGPKVLLVAVAMPAAFTVLLLSLLGCRRAERRERVRIVWRRSGLCVILLLMPTARPRPGPVSRVTVVRLVPRRRGDPYSGVVCGPREDGHLVRGAPLQRREVAVVLHVDGCVFRWRRVRPIDIQPVDKMRRIVGEDAGVASQTVARNPIPVAHVSTGARTDSRYFLSLFLRLTCICGCSSHG